MKAYRVRKGFLQGEIEVPSSKSHTLRAILFASLADGNSVIYRYLASTDTDSMIKACSLMGAKIDIFEDRLEIEGIAGTVGPFEDVIDAGNSGIVFRFFSAIGALSSFPVVITGDHSIRHTRPIKPLLHALEQLNVNTQTLRGDAFAPVIIKGPLKPGKTTIYGADSQPVSALLIAAAFANGPIEIEVQNPGEKPWVGLTLHWFDRLGIPYEQQGFDSFKLQGNANIKGFTYTVPGDFSTAAFPLAAAIVTGSELNIHNIDMEDVQGDKALIPIFQKMGANIEVNGKTLTVKKCAALKGTNVDINDFIDALPILAVVACYAEGTTHIYNGAVAKGKECNRIQTIATQLKKMGADINETADGLIIKRSTLKGAEVHSYQDHRMAMSLAIAGMGAASDTTISSVECVCKTFPDFAKAFQALGASIEELQ